MSEVVILRPSETIGTGTGNGTVNRLRVPILEGRVYELLGANFGCNQSLSLHVVGLSHNLGLGAPGSYSEVVEDPDLYAQATPTNGGMLYIPLFGYEIAGPQTIVVRNDSSQTCFYTVLLYARIRTAPKREWALILDNKSRGL